MSTKGHLFYHDTIEVYEETTDERSKPDGSFLGFDIYLLTDRSNDFVVEETESQRIVHVTGGYLYEEIGHVSFIVDKADIERYEYDTDGLLIVVIGGSPSAKRLIDLCKTIR